MSKLNADGPVWNALGVIAGVLLAAGLALGLAIAALVLATAPR